MNYTITQSTKDHLTKIKKASMIYTETQFFEFNFKLKIYEEK